MDSGCRERVEKEEPHQGLTARARTAGDKAELKKECKAQAQGRLTGSWRVWTQSPCDQKEDREAERESYRRELRWARHKQTDRQIDIKTPKIWGRTQILRLSLFTASFSAHILVFPVSLMITLCGCLMGS